DFREILFGIKLSDREKALLRVYLAKGLLQESIFKELETRGIRRMNLKIVIKIFFFQYETAFMTLSGEKDVQRSQSEKKDQESQGA
ncbi:7231_t:CDS:1, partial [Paraglomus brasilianum]